MQPQSFLPDEDVEDQECVKCGREMDYWNETMTIENGGESSLDDEGDIWIVWSPQDCKEAAFFYCKYCQVLQVGCKLCNSELQLKGHQGYSSDGSEWRRDAATGMKTQVTKAGKIDPNVPRFDTSGLGQNKINLDDWAACGPNYDQYHFWYCSNCKKDFKFTAGKA